ncbi:MAG: hypothetical protein ACJAZ9_001428 [Neolewinella sp.]|jgi:hypothetical protein
MIDKVLPVIIDELNKFIKHRFGLSENVAILSSLVDTSWAAVPAAQNKVVCMLTNIEQERTVKYNVAAPGRGGNPPLMLNLNLVFVANFQDYNESLKFLSLLLTFFHSKPVFTPQNTPELPEAAAKITVEINNLDQQSQNQLWAALGSSIMPSVNLKLRLITITSDQILAEIPEITAIETTATTPHN